ncbi:MAG TPA: tetratricopeptide repeat protein [Polyangiaceae bacterium]|nr:tetratricopeptide repeat protein [Polyangiaceae bacterium]
MKPMTTTDAFATPGRPYPCFEELACASEETIDVALGAALIARDVYDDLDVGTLLEQFEQLSAPLVRLDLGGMSAEAQALEMAHYIYERQGFAGNEADYYDPKNSLLPDVLERRLGIPITLGIVYCEIARRAGVPAQGVSFPGHFLVRIERTGQDRGRPPVMVDPFFGGRVLDEKSLVALLKRVVGPNEKLKPEHLEPASPRLILVRMLTNLKAVYLARGEDSRALLALHRLVALTPDAPFALRERGLLAARLGAVEVARHDLNRFLELTPEANDAKAIKARLDDLSTKRHWLN